MGLRDLGYRRYEGVRAPASRNTWVLYRHAVARAWTSWLVRLAVIFGWIPAAIAFLIALIKRGMSGNVEGPMKDALAINTAASVRSLFDWQFWLFVCLVTLGAGATAVARDLEFKAFRFYFAKPVLPWQYLTARVLAVATWCFILTFGPAVLYCGALAAVFREPEHLGAIIPAFIQACVLSLTLASASVGVSALGQSRGLTMSVWLTLMLAPHIIGGIVNKLGHFPWLLLGSLPAMLGVMGDALFKVGKPTDELHWYCALPILIAAAAAGIAFARHRITNAEVIS